MTNKYNIDDIVMIPFRIERVTMERQAKEPKYELRCAISSIRSDFPDTVIYADETRINEIRNNNL